LNILCCCPQNIQELCSCSYVGTPDYVRKCNWHFFFKTLSQLFKIMSHFSLPHICAPFGIFFPGSLKLFVSCTICLIITSFFFKFCHYSSQSSLQNTVVFSKYLWRSWKFKLCLLLSLCARAMVVKITGNSLS
jgi:hypothetical protein